MTILCIATYFKGEAFLRECRRQGCTVLLLTAETHASAAWPNDAIAEMHTIARGASDADIRRLVSSSRTARPADSRVTGWRSASTLTRSTPKRARSYSPGPRSCSTRTA